MNARHKLFAAEYVKNGNVGVHAVFAAGYKLGYNSACVRASTLLRNIKVKSMIDAVTDKANAEAELTAERVSREIARVAFAPDIEVDSTAKMKGLDLATKVLGMQSTKLETSDTSERDGVESAILKHVRESAESSQISENEAAKGLFLRSQSHPVLSKVESWPLDLQPALRELLSKPAEIREVEGEQ